MTSINKEFLSALTMTLITAFFAWGARDITGEAAVLPHLLLYTMAVINVLQYLLAFYRRKNDVNIISLLRKYPFKLVGVQFIITVIYIFMLLPLGFYLSSFLYIVIGSLAADPDKLTVRLVLIRMICCFAFVFFLWVLFSYGLGVVIPGFSLW